MPENAPLSQDILVYGTIWCGDTRRARYYLDHNHIPYQFIDIEKNLEGRSLVEKINHGNRSVPTIIFPDQSILVEPSEPELAAKCKALNL